MSYLVLHIDTEFIVGTVCADNGSSYPITNDSDDLLWLYFFNNPHQNRISFGKGNKAHYNNKEINYYGNFFELIENERETFTIRGIQKTTIELLDHSGLLKTLKERYNAVTHGDTDQIPTLITFSFSISELAKQKTIRYLKNQGFQIDSYTIPLSELTCYYPFSKKEFIPANGNAVLLLAATSASLHLMKLVFSDNYFMIDGNIKTCKGKGIDPRKRALVKFVVGEINKSVGALSTQDEIEDECARKEQKTEEWLRRLDIQQCNRPFSIHESLSIMPNTIKQVLVRKDNIENDTGHYIQELMDVFDAYKNDNIKGEVAAIFLLGDCFHNSLVKERFETRIGKEKLFLFTNKDIQQILSIYPTIDFKRYIDQEARMKALAEAEEQKQAEQRALEDRKRKEDETEARKLAEAKKTEQNRKDAEQLFERATELERDGKLEDARVNAENALALDKNNRGYSQFVSELIKKIDKLNAKNELYKSYLNKADKFLENSQLTQALDEYEAAQSVFDNVEITRKIIEVKRLIKKTDEMKATIAQLLSDAKSLKKQENYLLAQEKVNKIFSIDKEHSEAKLLSIKIEQLLQQQTARRQEEENKARCERILFTANTLFDENKWTEAQQQYEAASNLCPQEKAIKDKINKCAANIKAQEDAFSDLIFEATLAERKGKLQDALSFLNKALLLKSDDTLESRIKILRNKIKVDFGEEKKPKEKKSNEWNDFFNTEPICKKDKHNGFIENPRKEIENDDFLGVFKNKKDELNSKKNDFDNW